MTYDTQKALTLYGATGLFAAWMHSWMLIFFVIALGVLIWTPERYETKPEAK